MTGYFVGAVLFCVGVSMWALAEGREMWSAFWAMLAVVNAISYRLNQKPVPVEPE